MHDRFYIDCNRRIMIDSLIPFAFILELQPSAKYTDIGFCIRSFCGVCLQKKVINLDLSPGYLYIHVSMILII